MEKMLLCISGCGILITVISWINRLDELMNTLDDASNVMPSSSCHYYMTDRASIFHHIVLHVFSAYYVCSQQRGVARLTWLGGCGMVVEAN